MRHEGEGRIKSDCQFQFEGLVVQSTILGDTNVGVGSSELYFGDELCGVKALGKTQLDIQM